MPPTTTRNQLLAFRPRTAFPHARHLKLQGEYAKLRAADIEEWLRLHVLSQPPLSQPASTGPVTGPSSVTAGGAASGPGTGAGLAQGASHFMALDMSEVSLSGAVPVSFLTCLPERWPGLQQLSLHHTPLSCPLDCTDPVTLDRLIRNLYAQEVGAQARARCWITWVLEAEQKRWSGCGWLGVHRPALAVPCTLLKLPLQPAPHPCRAGRCPT